MKTFLETAQHGQITLENLISKRYYNSSIGWADMVLPDELREEFINGFISVLGGQKKTKERIFENLKGGYVRTCGILGRVVCKLTNKNEIRFSYIAGQDYSSELQFIRKYLYK